MSSPVVSVCPHCEKKIKVKKPELIGKKVKCPGCAQPFRLEPYEETYSLSQPATEPEPSSADDDWINALGEAAQSGEPLDAPQSSGGLPPITSQTKTKKKKPREFGPEPVPGSDDDDRYGYGAEEGMSRGLVGAIVGGVIAGAIGALVWGGIAYATEYEVAYVAWGIGALVGFGVLLGAQEYAGVTTGILALVLANLSIFAGKVFCAWLIFNNLAGAALDMNEFAPFQVNEQSMISSIAYDITEKREAAGEELVAPREDLANFDFSKDYPADIWQEARQRWQNMPPDKKAELKADEAPNAGESYLISLVAEEIVIEREAAGQDIQWPEPDFSLDHPPGIWKEAEAEWAALSPEEKQQRKQEAEKKAKEAFEGLVNVLRPSLIRIVFDSLGPIDGLWILLASFTAYRIGANDHEDD